MDFDWDEGNAGKNLHHGVHDWEIEEALSDSKAFIAARVVISGEDRFILLGRSATSGKYLRVVFAARMKAGGAW